MSIDEQFIRLEEQGIPKYFIQCVNKMAYGVGFVGSYSWEKTLVGYIKTYWDFFGSDLNVQKDGEEICKKVFYHFTVSNNNRKSLLPSVSDLLERRYIIQKDIHSKEYWEQINKPVKRTEKQSKNISLFYKKFTEQRTKKNFCYKTFLKDNDYLIKKKGD